MSLDYMTMNQIEALGEEFDRLFDICDLDDDYADYIMENCHGERTIGNGDMLIEAMEQGYLYQDFKQYWVEQRMSGN